MVALFVSVGVGAPVLVLVRYSQLLPDNETVPLFTIDRAPLTVGVDVVSTANVPPAAMVVVPANAPVAKERVPVTGRAPPGPRSASRPRVSVRPAGTVAPPRLQPPLLK